jgi:hypothetical protein
MIYFVEAREVAFYCSKFVLYFAFKSGSFSNFPTSRILSKSYTMIIFYALPVALARGLTKVDKIV